ncbi:MAG TPA: hypothetical protein VF712_03920 [Thermoleophilaceae bacterium]
MVRRIGRFLASAGALVALTAAVAGCHQEVAGVSDSCTVGATTLNDGFLADRSVFFRVATKTDPANPSTTWLCYRVKVADQYDDGQRIDVNPNTSIGTPRVASDTNSQACATAAGNVIPPPHPIEQGQVLGTPFYLDANATLLPGAWLCLEVGNLKQRLIAELPGLDIADVDVNNDPAPPAPVDTTPPPLGKASTACSTGTLGESSELINLHLQGRDVFLYTARPNTTTIHVCARISGPQSGGARLSVNAAPDQIVRVETSPDVTPCTQDIVTLSNPPLSLKITPAGQTPPSICLNGTRYTVVTGPLPPVVSFAIDS